MPYKRSQDPPSATRGRSRRIRTKNAVHSKTCVACLCALAPVIHEGLNVGHVDLGMGAAGSSVGGHEGFPGDAPVAVSEVSWTVAGGWTSG
jgi:hypothetical protein